MDIGIVILNFLYAALGVLISLISMWVGYKWFDSITSFSINDELKNGNIAVGQVLMGLCVGVGLTVGLCVSAALN